MAPLAPEMPNGGFPQLRMRRLRRYDWMRQLVQENRLHCSDLIWAVIVRDPSLPATVPTMPGLYRYTVEEIPKALDTAYALGIRLVALFPALPNSLKNEDAKEILNPDGMLNTAIRTIKKYLPNLGIISDVALDPFTTHGQDGLIFSDEVDNDQTLAVLAQAAVLQAQAGADIIGPSDMMDGRVNAIRSALDANGFNQVAIASYAAKYASTFYGPYRDAVNTSQCLGRADKKTYQMDPANGEEAVREAALDLQEGADMLIVKPGLPYLDIVHRLNKAFNVPILSFHVSGEYAMLKAAASLKMIQYEPALYESLIAFKRAGASGIITYAALDAAKIIKELNHAT